jgi:co-chaperonin GroES (HSP10)
MASETEAPDINTSGWIPLGHRILVLPDIIEETYGESKIVVAKELVDKEQNAQVTGTVIAIGPGAWLDTTVDKWCTVGTRVIFGKYAGLYLDGKDGKRYRWLNDVDLVAGENPDWTAPASQQE